MRSSDTSHVHDYDEIVTGGFFGISELKEPPDPGPAGHVAPPVIAAHITGKPGGGEGKKTSEINVVFIADLDMISNEFFFIRDKEWQGLKLDNINFVLNAVDQLAGDDAFLDLRARRPQHRTLERVERLTKAFKEHESEEAARLERETKDKIDELSKRLQKEIDEIEARTDLDPRTKAVMARQKQEARERELEVFRATQENDKKKRLKRLKDETERDIRRIETQIRLMAIGFPPVPALVLGLVVFAGRLRAERMGIVPDRLVGKR
jgi:ABC-2 type transport system permease protein